MREAIEPNVFLRSLSSGRFELRPINETYLQTLYEWRNKPEVRRWMVNDSPIEWSEHVAWFDRLKTSTTQVHFVIIYAGRPVGVSNIRSLNSGLPNATAVELGLYYGEDDFRGSLLTFVPAMLTIEYCLQDFTAEKLIAKVKPDNTAALRFNQTLGYQKVSEGCYIEMELTAQAYFKAVASLQRLKAV